jgi:hypothetical protein
MEEKKFVLALFVLSQILLIDPLLLFQIDFLASA